MSLIQRIVELAKAIGQDIKTLKSRVLSLETSQTVEKKYVYRTPKGASWMNGNSYFQLTRIGNLVVAGADGDSWATVSITPPTDANFNKLPKRESTVDGKGGTWLQIQITMVAFKAILLSQRGLRLLSQHTELLSMTMAFQWQP